MSRAYSETAPKSSFPVAGPFQSGTVRTLLTAVSGGLGRLSDRLLTWQQRAQDRRALRALDAHMLHDIGLSRSDVERESSKHFWQS